MGLIRAKQNVFLPQVNSLIHYAIHIPLEDRRNVGEMNTCTVSRPSIQSYIITYYRLRKRGALIALGGTKGGGALAHTHTQR